MQLVCANLFGGYIMNLANMDMKKEFEEYNKIAPVRTVKLNGGDFAYRYYKNPNDYAVSETKEIKEFFS